MRYPMTIDFIRDAIKGTPSTFTFHLAAEQTEDSKFNIPSYQFLVFFHMCVMRKLFRYIHCYVTYYNILIIHYILYQDKLHMCICIMWFIFQAITKKNYPLVPHPYRDTNHPESYVCTCPKCMNNFLAWKVTT
jgi:hypothetical protein